MKLKNIVKNTKNFVKNNAKTIGKGALYTGLGLTMYFAPINAEAMSKKPKINVVETIEDGIYITETYNEECLLIKKHEEDKECPFLPYIKETKFTYGEVKRANGVIPGKILLTKNTYFDYDGDGNRDKREHTIYQYNLNKKLIKKTVVKVRENENPYKIKTSKRITNYIRENGKKLLKKEVLIDRDNNGTIDDIKYIE